MTTPESTPTNNQPRVLSHGDVEAVVDHFIERLTDRRTVEAITDVWSGALDRAIGRGVRRVAYGLAFALLMLGALKFDLLSKFLSK